MASIISVILKNVASYYGLEAVSTILQGLNENEKRKAVRQAWSDSSSESEILFNIMGL